jgi:hypothetical protein
MQRRLSVMDLRLGQLPDRAMILIEQDDQRIVRGRGGHAG